jgi:hypothetical protein
VDAATARVKAPNAQARAKAPACRKLRKCPTLAVPMAGIAPRCGLP